ncbi:MAG: S41 family peptidase [Agathobacter sp.]|nr:S41 family peptidase [Agathobacter sp.]
MSDKDLKVYDFNPFEDGDEPVEDRKAEDIEVTPAVEVTPIPVPAVEPPRRKSKFWIGFVAAVVTMAVTLGMIGSIFTSLGGKIVIGNKGQATQLPDSNLLDPAVVEKIDEIYSYMYLYYYEDFEKEDIVEMMYKGVMSGLDDPYSVYYTKEEYQELMVDTSGKFYGIGAGLTQDLKTMEVTISKVYRGTPAEEAGLMNGDKILMVNDIDATSMELDKLVQSIRGEEFTEVYLKIYRESTEEILEFNVVRRQVIIPSIEYEMLANNVGYVQITDFQDQTDEQFEEAIKALKEQGMEGIIVDVRANPGGYVTTVCNILDTILPKGVVVYTEDKYGNRSESKSDADCLEMPMVVLMDGNSASASEIFVGAIKDYEWGTLIGTTTYGKGIVQTIITLEDGDAIKLTTSKYFTPNGNYIHGVGIDPDIEIEYEYQGPIDQPYDKQYDNQFLKAVEVINEMLK